MKKILLLISLVIPQLIFAQTKANKWGVSASSGVYGYSGDIGSQIFKLETRNIGSGVTGSKYLNSNFNLDIAFNVGAVDVNKPDVAEHFRTKFNSLGANIRYKLNNGKVMEEYSNFQPYAFTGLGLTSFDALHFTNNEGSASVLTNSSKVIKNKAFNIPVGLGLNYLVRYNLAIGVQTSLNMLMSDEFDAFTTKTDANDIYYYNAFVLTYTPGDRDTDRDGVADNKDKCPSVPGSMKHDGCPDRDNDGVVDMEDKCPDVPGLVYGCPDKDGDGLNDDLDKCPEIPGLVNGCPDTDGDGFADTVDKCPNIAGRLDGCPDSDNDGIIDAEDNCPNGFGTIFTNGCPDIDGDGVVDTEDECPESYGTADNKGCPKVAEQMADGSPVAESGKIKTILSVYFESNTNDLAISYNVELDKLIKIMNSSKSMSMIVEGHTDATGSDNANKLLSEKRMTTIAQYLTTHGVAKNRLELYSFGESQPLVPNITKEGREKNRRVVVKVITNF
ncbi:MAG: OOP family OmpA-OmpF porin [Flavobacteriales bacterium]|jgi:OOP family OmpA-OmpF porin